MDATTHAWERPEFVWPTVGHPGRVPLEALVPNPLQPRKHFDDDELDSLAATIDEKNGGEQREIVTVRELTPEEHKKYPFARYMLISGERRWRALQKAGAQDIEIRVKKYASRAQEKLDMFMLNNNRVQLSDIENALYLADLMEEFGWDTQRELATGIGQSEVWVGEHLALLNLSPNSRALMSPRLAEQERLKRNVGVFLSRLSFAAQDELTPTMPKGGRVTGTQQIRWLQEQLKGTPHELENKQLQPSTLRRIVGYYADQVERRAQELLAKKGFEHLFTNAMPEQVNDLLGRIKDAQAELGELVEKIKNFAGPGEAPALKEGPVETLTPAAKPSAQRATSAPAKTPQQPLGVVKPEPVEPAPTVSPTVPVGRPRRVIAAPFREVRDKHLPKAKTAVQEITVTFEHANGRMVTDKVSPSRYVELWNAGLLKHQVQGTPKPDFLKTPEEVMREITSKGR